MRSAPMLPASSAAASNLRGGNGRYSPPEELAIGANPPTRMCRAREVRTDRGWSAYHAERDPYCAGHGRRPGEMQARERLVALRAWHLSPTNQLSDGAEGNRAAAHYSDPLRASRTRSAVGRPELQRFPAKRAHESSSPLRTTRNSCVHFGPPGLRSAGFALCHAISIGQKRACYGLTAPRKWASGVRADV